MKYKKSILFLAVFAALCMSLIAGTLCGCSQTDDVIIHSGSHELIHVERKEPTCSENGNIEYWQCRLCKRCFTDENAGSEVKDVGIAHTGHHFSSVYHWDETSHYRTCTACGMHDSATPYPHILRYGIDDEQNGHYQYCYCGYRTEVVAHTPDEDGSGLCKFCRYGRPEYTLSDDGTYYIVSKTTMPFKENITEFTVPDMFNDLPIKEIADRAFENCTELQMLRIGRNVVSVGAYAFKDCTKLTDITLNDGLLSIGANAFLSCRSLTQIAIPESVNNIDNSAFSGCKLLESINIPSSVTVLKHNMFYGCSALKSLTVHNGVVSIAYALLSESGIEEFVFPDAVTAVSMTVFLNCASIRTVTIPATVRSIGAGSFQNCSLETLYFLGTEAEWDRIDLISSPVSWCKGSHFTVVGKDFTRVYSDGNAVLN